MHHSQSLANGWVLSHLVSDVGQFDDSRQVFLLLDAGGAESDAQVLGALHQAAQVARVGDAEAAPVRLLHVGERLQVEVVAVEQRVILRETDGHEEALRARRVHVERHGSARVAQEVVGNLKPNGSNQLNFAGTRVPDRISCFNKQGSRQ